MKRALIIGINYYEENNCLHGCVNDAIQVAAILGKNGDGSPNFDVRKLIATDSSLIVRKKDFIENLQYLFEDDVDTALFYYSGHGGADRGPDRRNDAVVQSQFRQHG